MAWHNRMWQSSSLAVFWTSTRRSSWLTPAKRCGRRFQKLCSHANMCEAGTRPLVLTRTTNGVHPKWGSHAIIYTGRKRCVTHKLYAEATGIWHRGSHPSGRLPAVPHIETSPESLARLPRPELTSVPSEPTETSATLGLRPKQVGIQKDGRTRIKEKAKQEESIRNKTQGVKRREIRVICMQPFYSSSHPGSSSSADRFMNRVLAIQRYDVRSKLNDLSLDIAEARERHCLTLPITCPQ